MDTENRGSFRQRLIDGDFGKNWSSVRPPGPLCGMKSSKPTCRERIGNMREPHDSACLVHYVVGGVRLFRLFGGLPSLVNVDAMRSIVEALWESDSLRSSAWTR
jgi:hypothetical protein